MKLIKKLNIKKQFETVKSRQGSFATSLIAIAIIIVIVFNLLVSQLPESWSDLDVSGRDLYSISDTTVEFLQTLDTDIQLVVLAESGTIDSRIEKFINKYAELSDHISLEYIDPVQYPSALQTYEAEQDSVVVICEENDNQEVIPFSDIIQYDETAYYTMGQYSETAFDAEGQLTSAIDYVTNDNTKIAYELSGHNETQLSDKVKEQMEKSHFTINSLNLLSDGGIPEDCDLIICNAPTSDLADDELDMLKEYLSTGGHLTILLSYEDTDTPNLNSLMKSYGIEVKDGYVADYSLYYQNNPYIFFPVLSSESSITSGFSEDSLALVYNCRGLEETTPSKDTITTETFMSTSSQAAVVTDTTETSGEYAIAISATDEIDEETKANLTVYGAQSIIADDIISAFANVINLDVFMNSLTNDFTDIENISIEPKSLTTTYNTITNSGLWSSLFVAIIPLGFLIFGLVHWLKRRKL